MRTRRDKFRILHTTNIAGVPSTLSRELNKRGYYSVVVEYRPGIFSGLADYNLGLEKKNFFAQLAERVKLFKKCLEFDIIHMHSSSVLPFYVDAPLFQLFGKKIVYHHHGSDIRYRGVSFFSKHFCNLRLVSTPDLKEWAPDAVWFPNPVSQTLLKQLKSRKRESNENENPKEIVVLHSPRGNPIGKKNRNHREPLRKRTQNPARL